MDAVARGVKYNELIKDIENSVLLEEYKTSYKAMLITEILLSKKYRYLTLTGKETAYLFELLSKN